jgi:GGDEF domain-containing protein
MLLFKLSQPMVFKGESVQCTVSICMVVFPDDGDEVDILLELAEEAMQCAKQQGGGQCCFYNSVLQQQYLRANR